MSFAACGELGSTLGTPRVARRDSAGIAIVETPGAVARAPIGWTVDTVPDLQLGGADGPGPEQFYQIGISAGGIRGLPDGGILVVDGASAELRYFDASGGFLRKSGGQGAGPGEFQRPRLLPYSNPDSLLIQDVARNQFTVLGLGGTPGRTFVLPLDDRGRPFTGSPQGARPEGVLVPGTVRSSEGPIPVGRSRSLGMVRWIRAEGPRVDSLARSEVFEFYAVGLYPNRARLEVPFSAAPSGAVTRDGFLVTRGATPELLEFTASGQLKRILRIEEPPRPVTPADIETALEAEAVFRELPVSQLRPFFEEMEFPAEHPAFQSLLVDDLGWVWARVYLTRWDLSSRWVVFDPEGVARGVIDLPFGVEVHHIGADFFLGRWRNDLGVEYVRRYRFERGP